MTVAVLCVENLMVKFIRIISVILLILWSTLIFDLSSENATTSSKTSGGIVQFVINIVIPDYEELPEAERLTIRSNFQFVIRKTAHFTIYCVLGVLAFLSIFTYSKISFYARCSLSAAFCLIYAISDEIHQRYIPGRSGEVRDVCIDFCGALLGILLINLFIRITKIEFFKKYIK